MRRLHDEGGQAVIEFALVLPVLMLVMTAIAQVAITFNHYLTLTDAVRAGARTAAVSRLATDPTGTAKAAVVNAGHDLGLSASNVDVSTTWKAGTDVTVSASYDYSISIVGLALKTGTLHSSTTERVE